MARQRGSSGYEQAADAQAQAGEPSLVDNRVSQSEVGTVTMTGNNGTAMPLATALGGAGPDKVKAPKPKRRMSTGLQICARIERILAELDDKTHHSVLRWIKDIEARSGNASGQA